MKKFLSVAFSLYLLLVNSFIVVFISYYALTVTFYIELAMVFLFYHGTFSVFVSVAFLTGIFWARERTYIKVEKFISITRTPYILSHFAGIIYYSFIIGSLESKEEQLPYRILIFYLMVNLAVFWWIHTPVVELSREALMEKYVSLKKKEDEKKKERFE